MADARKGRGKEFGRETAREGDKKGGAEGVSFPNLARPESPSSFLLNDSKGGKKTDSAGSWDQIPLNLCQGKSYFLFVLGTHSLVWKH